MARRLTALALTVAVLLPLQGRAAPPDFIVKAGTLLSHAPVILVAYTEPIGMSGARIDLVAWPVDQGIHVIAFKDPTPPQGLGNEPGTLGDTTVEEATVTGARLELVPNPADPANPNIRFDAVLPNTGAIHLTNAGTPWYLGGYGDLIIPGLYTELSDARTIEGPLSEPCIGVDAGLGTIAGFSVDGASSLKWSRYRADLAWIYTG